MAYQEEAIRFEGKYMDLSQNGMAVLEKEIKKRFNEKNIDKLAEMACSNSCEAFYSVLTKFSEGKRLNLEHTDLWKNMILLVFCRTGNIEETHQELSDILGLDITSAETRRLASTSKKRKQNREMAESETGKRRRHESKITTAIRMGKEDSKTKHKSEKLSTTKQAKSEVKVCSKCHKFGHPTKDCPVLKLKRKSKKRKMLTDWNIIPSREPSAKAKRYVAKVKW